MNKVIKNVKKIFGTNICFTADPLAMAVMIEPEIVIESTKKYVGIELSGRYTRGMTVVDWFGASRKGANVRVVQKVKMDRFIELMYSIIE